MATVTSAWKVWDNEQSYGDTLYRRAIGDLPEMESSKKVAQEIASVYRAGDSICDVGCGAGHYLRSLDRVLEAPPLYTGVDATSQYVELGRKAFSNRPNTEFLQSDIFDIELPDGAHEIVMCNNVLLHLPSILQPLNELVRISKKYVFVRFLVGDRSFRVQDVHSQPGGGEFDDSGEPVGFHFYNIYSEAYVNHILSSIPRIQDWSLTPDRDYNAKAITNSISDHGGARDASYMVGDFQVNGYIMQPWSILKIEL